MIIQIFFILALLLRFLNAQQCSLLNEHNMYCHQNPIIGYQISQKYNYYITYEQQGIIIAWDYNQNYPLKQQDINVKNIKYAKITDSDNSFMVYSSDGIVSFFNLWDFSFKNSTQIPNQNQLPLIYLESIGYLVHLNVLNYQLTLLSTWKQQQVEQIILDLSNILGSNNKILIFDSLRQQFKPAFIVSTGEIYLIDLKSQSYSLLTKIIFSKGDNIKDAKQVNSKLLFVLSSLGNIYFFNIEQSQNIIQLNSSLDQNQIIQQIKLSYLDDNLNSVYFIGKTQVFYFDSKSPTQILSFEVFNNQNKDNIKQIDIYQQQLVFINEDYEVFLFSNNILRKNNNFIYSKKNKIHFTSINALNYALYFDDPSVGLIIFDITDSIRQIYQCYNTTEVDKDVYGVTIPTLTQQYQFQYGPYLNLDSKNQLLLKYYQNSLSLFNLITKSFLYVKKNQELVNIQINQFNIISAVILSQNTVLSFNYFTGQIITKYKFMCSIQEMITLSTRPSIIVTNSFQKQTDSSCDSQVAIIDLSTQNYQQLDGMLPEIKSQSLLRVGISEQQNVVVNQINVKRDILFAGINSSIIIYYCQWTSSQTGSNNQYSCQFAQSINFNSVYQALQIEYDMNYNLSFVLFRDQKSLSVFSLNSTSGNLIKQSQYEFQIQSFTIIQQSTGLIFFTQSPRSQIFSTQNSYTQFYSQIIKNKDFDNFPIIHPLDNNYKKTSQFSCLKYSNVCLKASLIVQSDGMFTSSNDPYAVSLFGALSPQKDDDSITELFSSFLNNILFYSQRSNKLNIIFDTQSYSKIINYNIPSNFIKIVELDNSHILALTQDNQEINISYKQNRNILTLSYTPDFAIDQFSIDQFNAFIFDEELQTVSKDYQNCWIVGSSSDGAQQIAYVENFQIQINSGFTFDGKLQKVMKFNNFFLLITYTSTDTSFQTQVYILKISIDSQTQQTILQNVAEIDNLPFVINVIYDRLTQRIYFYGTSASKQSNYIYYILYQDIQNVLKGQLDQSKLQYYYVQPDIMQQIKLNIVNLFIYEYADDERNIYQLNDQESSSVLIIVTTREIITIAQKLDPTSPQIYRILNYLNSQYQILKANISIPLKSLIIFPSFQRTLEIRSVIKQNQAINLISKNNLFYQNIFFVDEEMHSRFILCGNTSCQYFKIEKIKNSQQQQQQTNDQSAAYGNSGSQENNNSLNQQNLPIGSIDQISRQQQLTQQERIDIGPNYQIVQILTYTQQITLTDVQNIAIYSQFIETMGNSYQQINIKDYETGKLVNSIIINSYAIDLIYNKYLNNLHILNKDSVMFFDISEMMTQSSQTITDSIAPNFNIIKYYHKMKQTTNSLTDQNFYYLIGSQNGLILKQDFEKDIFQIEFSLGSEILGGFTFKEYNYFYSFGAILKVTQTDSNKNTYQKYLNFNNQGYKILQQKQDNNIVVLNEYLIGVSYPQTLKVYSEQNGDIIQVKELKLQSNILNICQDNQTYEQQFFIADNIDFCAN
ncbi:hypothetical protein TTHERM_00525170 (macronuclear) [Tetrahymena thermophila SB210]|uniref:Transmembrane protein n=1 Tax=Tetrahymena thermophila (strain SB210) TaxID=312017 RepID=I7MN27_TETTS|nr:hypothetical protein TTHERM_00525170 [Tetrahymena thermophila SB210]EAS07785.2 hypothetical protein TTHERM_00525170 [Tetrahymena thermophila SB210]|eukprot:XP_001028027.2 hypothetical protein TTHERM_00525170 [Tetrahymena thermophila SB210]